MVIKQKFRLICSVIGIFGIAFIATSKVGSPFSYVGIIFCVFLIIFSYVVTSKYIKYLGGEPEEVDNRGSMSQHFT